MLSVDVMPALRDPVLVLALSGWVDAGESGAQAAAWLSGQLEGGRVFARYDLRDVIDLSQTRPRTFLDGDTRRIEWPAIAISAGHAGRDVIVCTGPEPSLRWPTFTHELATLFSDLGVSYVCTLAGVPAMVSHRIPTSVLVTTTSEAMAQEVGAVPHDYLGQTGAQNVIQFALAEAGVPGVGLWAQVPHYVAANPAPSGARALLERLIELTEVELDLGPLDEQVAAYTAAIEAGLSERPDVAGLVQAIEDEMPEEASGDDLAAEVERFLREHREQ